MQGRQHVSADPENEAEMKRPVPVIRLLYTSLNGQNATDWLAAAPVTRSPAIAHSCGTRDSTAASPLKLISSIVTHNMI